MEQFAVEALFRKKGDDIEFVSGKFVSTRPGLSDMVNIEKEVFDPLCREDERINVLRDGTHQAYITGRAYPEIWGRERSYVFTTEERNIKYILIPS